MGKKRETSAQQTERMLSQTKEIERLQRERARLIQMRLGEIEAEIEDLVIERDFLTERLRDKRSEPTRILEREILARLRRGEAIPPAGSRNPQYKEALTNLRKQGFIKNLNGLGQNAKWVLAEKTL